MSLAASNWATRVAIKGCARHLLQVMAVHANDCNQLWTGLERLAAETGVSVRYARTAKSQLIAAGLITAEENRRPDGTRTTDMITLHVTDLPDVLPARAAVPRQEHAGQCMKAQLKASGTIVPDMKYSPLPPQVPASPEVETHGRTVRSSSDNRPSVCPPKGRPTPKRPAAGATRYTEHPQLERAWGKIESAVTGAGGFGNGRQLRREVNVALFSGWDPLLLVQRMCVSYAGADHPWAVAFARVREPVPGWARSESTYVPPDVGVVLAAQATLGVTSGFGTGRDEWAAARQEMKLKC